MQDSTFPSLDTCTTRTASKTFNICYAHRVHNQALLLPKSCKCRLLHGHNASITFSVSYTQAQPLGERGMDIDFNDFSGLKYFLDNYLDHRTILGSGDPLLKFLDSVAFEENYENPASINIAGEHILTVLGEANPVESVQEFLNSFVVVDAHSPTSEELARWLACKILPLYLAYIGVQMPMSLTVDWSETDTSVARISSYPSEEVASKLTELLFQPEARTACDKLFNPAAKPLTHDHIKYEPLVKGN